MDISNIIPHIEALIFASEKPLTALELTELINNAFGFMEDKITLDQVESAIEGIIEKYNSEFYPFEMKESGGGWQFLTKKDFHKTVAQLNGEKFLKRLSAASLETLAIIAYKQPITKGEVESIRGVNSDYSIQKLLEKELIIITGRNETLPGKPLVYATSRSFMDYFGINSAEELPSIKEILGDRSVEATVVNRHDQELSEPSEEAANIQEDDDDVLLVIRGNGELIETPHLVVNEDTTAINPDVLNSDDEDIVIDGGANRLMDEKLEEETRENDDLNKNEKEAENQPG
ncbi:MAG: SMC-Scp complex subunit ScpB [Chitinophagaceae bacterium]